MQPYARKDAAVSMVAVDVLEHADAASVGLVLTAPNALPIPDALMDHADDLGNVDAALAGLVISVTRN